MTTDEIVDALFARFAKERAAVGGRPLTLEESKKCAREVIAAARSKKKVDPDAPRPPRPRNPLFDALAVVCSYDLSELGDHAGKVVGTALADIKRVCPKVTPEEITRRGKLIRAKYEKSGPMAIAGHWAEFAPPKNDKPDIYKEPDRWHAAAIRAFGEEVGAKLIEKGWAEIRTLYGLQIYRNL